MKIRDICPIDDDSLKKYTIFCLQSRSLIKYKVCKLFQKTTTFLTKIKERNKKSFSRPKDICVYI